MASILFGFFGEFLLFSADNIILYFQCDVHFCSFAMHVCTHFEANAMNYAETGSDRKYQKWKYFIKCAKSRRTQKPFIGKL